MLTIINKNNKYLKRLLIVLKYLYMEKLLTESIENYLEFMYTKELEGEKWIKPLDMASFFSFSRSAITKASDKLNELGYIIKEK